MDRKERQAPKWVVDEESELVRDREVAERYGFETVDITVARNDLVAFLCAFHDNPFREFEEIRPDIRKILLKLRVIHEDIKNIVDKTQSLEIAEVLTDIGRCTERLAVIQEDLPQRAHYLQRCAVRYLMGFWRHVDRKGDGSIDRRVVVSFNGDEPIHRSMKFILEMLRRTPGGDLKGVGRSTIMHARYKRQEDIPHPSKVYAFKGHPRFL